MASAGQSRVASWGCRCLVKLWYTCGRHAGPFVPWQIVHAERPPRLRRNLERQGSLQTGFTSNKMAIAFSPQTVLAQPLHRLGSVVGKAVDLVTGKGLSPAPWPPKAAGDEVLDIDSRVANLLDAVSNTIGTQQAAFLLPYPEQGGGMRLLQLRDTLEVRETSLSLDSPLVLWLQEQKQPYVWWDEVEALPQSREAPAEERELFRRLNAHLLVPVRLPQARPTPAAGTISEDLGLSETTGAPPNSRPDGALSGIIVVGENSEGNGYPRKALHALANVAKASARGIENARLYALEQARSRELQQASQMKSEYIFNISHQLKTPISAVKASAEMLTDSHVSRRKSARGWSTPLCGAWTAWTAWSQSWWSTGE